MIDVQEFYVVQTRPKGFADWDDVREFADDEEAFDAADALRCADIEARVVQRWH